MEILFPRVFNLLRGLCKCTMYKITIGSYYHLPFFSKIKRKALACHSLEVCEDTSAK